jgi:hypothetical protein
LLTRTAPTPPTPPTLRAFLTQKLGNPSPSTQLPFQFDFVSRDEQIAQYCDEVLVPRYELYRRDAPDKSVYAAAFVYGQSGMGKSRLSRDLVPQARAYLARKGNPPAGLVDLLDRCTTLLIDLRHNGDGMDEEEMARLDANVLIGLRVAAKYWGYAVSRLRHLILTEPAVRERFKLAEVLDAISAEVVAAGAPPRMLHIALDELHYYFDQMLRYEGRSINPPSTEPLARAVMRVAMRAADTAVRPGLFVVSTFAGTVLLPPSKALLPTEERCLSIGLPPLALQDMRHIVDKHMAQDVPADVRQAPWFDLLLRSLGGLPRCLEHVRELPKHGYLCLVSEEPLRAIKKIGSLLAKRYLLPPEAALAPYLALGGVPVKGRDTVSPAGTDPTSVRVLQERGFVSLVEAPSDDVPWVDRWGAAGDAVLNMPLALVIAATTERHSAGTCVTEQQSWCVLTLCAFHSLSGTVASVAQADRPLGSVLQTGDF